MTAVDTNILVYAHRAEMPWHREAERCVRTLAEGAASWAIPWPCVHEFLSVVTNRRAFRTPTPRNLAVAQVEKWRASPSLVLLAEGEGYWNFLCDLLVRGDIVGPKVHDARIAALCQLHGIDELWTADRDFNRFPSLKTRNPLIPR